PIAVTDLDWRDRLAKSGSSIVAWPAHARHLGRHYTRRRRGLPACVFQGSKHPFVIPAQAGIHPRPVPPSMDSRLRGNDVVLTTRRAEKRSAFRRFGQPWRMALSLIRPTDYRKLAD